MNIERSNDTCRITSKIDQALFNIISDELSYEMPGFSFRSNKRWDGIYRLLNKSTQIFPSGLLDRLTNILDENGVDWTITDNREPVVKGRSISLPKDSNFKPRDYQSRAINKCLKSGSGIVRMCTGSGKSFVIASIIAKLNVKTIIYVVSVDLLYQMVDTMKESYNIDAGIVGDGKCIVKDITVMTIWSAGSAFNKKMKTDKGAKKEKINNDNKSGIRNAVTSAELILLDEGQYAGSATFQFLAANSPCARYRFLFSGTPWREQGDDILLEAYAGKKIVDIRATELIKKGFLIKPYITFKKIPAIINPGKTYNDVYKTYIIENEVRNDFIISSALKMKDKGMVVMVLFKNITHGKFLFDEISKYCKSAAFLDGKKSSKIRSETINSVKNGKIKIVVASTIFDIGVDIPNASCLILAQSGKSRGRFLQRVGRVIRKSEGKKFALVLDFLDQCKYLRDHSMARKSACEEESGFAVKIIDE